MHYAPPTIERLRSVDDTLAEQLNPLFDEGTRWDHEQGRRFLQDANNLFLIARCGGSLGGFLTAHRLQRWDRRRAEVLLYEIGVDEAFRRRGVGTALVAELQRWAKETGADEVWVLTYPDNAAAMGLYASTGAEQDPSSTVMFTYRLE